MGTRRTYRGFEGFVEWAEPFADAMPDSTATPGVIIAPGDRSVDISFTKFFRLRDGKVVRRRYHVVRIGASRGQSLKRLSTWLHITEAA